MIAYKFRLYPTKPQAAELGNWLYLCRQLYNAALQERRDAYRKCGVSVSYRMQQDSLLEVKEVRPEYRQLHSQVLQDVMRRLDKAFQGFFRRAKAGQKPGYPRFQGRGRYDSFTYPQYKSGIASDAKHIYLPKIGNVRIRLHRPIKGCIKTATVKREGTEWYIIFAAEAEQLPLPATGSKVGLDLGLHHTVVTSDGEFVEAPRYFRKAQKRLRRAQRSLARKKRGSKRREKARQHTAKLHRRVARQRADFNHKLSRRLVNENDLIAHEALNIQGLARTNLAKSVHDAAWRQLLQMLSYKAEWAGRQVVAVNPAYTTQTCAACGARQKMPLRRREYRCGCGHSEHRDVNAAQVILAWARPSGANVAAVSASVA